MTISAFEKDSYDKVLVKSDIYLFFSILKYKLLNLKTKNPILNKNIVLSLVTVINILFLNKIIGIKKTLTQLISFV